MKDPFTKNDIKIAVIGGGTGSFTLLSELKNYTSQLVAIVNMADDGGSTGVLRDEYGTLPPGDVRQCLVALSTSPKIRDLFDYRFAEGSLEGHSFGNLFLTALEKVTGDFSEAVETASEVLRVNGRVLPATLSDVRLKLEWSAGNGHGRETLFGENNVTSQDFKHDPRKAKLSLTPKAKVNKMAIKAIEQADLVIVAPGNLYSSLGPLLVIDGVGKALRDTKATKVYVSNLVTKNGQTDKFTVADHADELERFAGGQFLDYVLYNNAKPSAMIQARYKAEKAYLTKPGKDLQKKHYQVVPGDFLGKMAREKKGDKFIRRSLIRHNAKSVVQEILKLVED